MAKAASSSKIDAQDLLNILKRSDIAFALGLIGILIIMILPLPRLLLDISLALSLAFSVVVLMNSLFILRPLDFSSFPTVLLVATMLRLGLNIASTRLILTNGHEGPEAAGEVIRAFGNFIMQGNFVIGIIVFAILVIVNFVVITKGSGRIAEVSARFSLDAMPGKQMAIDADLSAGIINEGEAKKRRKDLEGESNFYGAMDGAAKFVRGDAVAGLMITFVNVIGGIIIGVVQKGISLSEAAHTYTLLTVGDGLVSQIPALIISTAAGLLVSKASAEESVEKAILTQLSAYPTALGICSFLLIVMAFLPGLPFFPFACLAVAAGTCSWYLSQKKKIEKNAKDEKEKNQKELTEDEYISKALKIDEIRIELGYGLLPLVNDDEGFKLTDQIKALRRQLASDLGFILPSVRVQDNLRLDPNKYRICIKDVEAAGGDIEIDKFLVLGLNRDEQPFPGIKTSDPTFGLPALWVAPNFRIEAEAKGYTVVEARSVIITHLTEIIKDNVAELLSYTEVQKILDELDQSHKKLLGDMLSGQITIGVIQKILQSLLNERVSIRDLPTILEGISEASTFSKNVLSITEHVRSRLSRQLCAAYMDAYNTLPIVTLSPQWEKEFSSSLSGEGESKHLSMAPTRLQDFIQACKALFDKTTIEVQNPVLLTSGTIRPYVRSVIERFRPSLVVMSQNEIHPKVKIKTVGSL